LIQLSSSDNALFQSAFEQTATVWVLNIRNITAMLEEHFNQKNSSRLPVIAIYAIYELLMARIDRYAGKKLIPLQVHTSSDKHGFGDIEIYETDDRPFEIIEIKHNVPLNRFQIFDILKKTEKTAIVRYYILTTYKNGFETTEEEELVSNLISQAQKERNIDIIANGILTTLKYYLRFLDDYDAFIKSYTAHLIADAHHSTEVKNFHIEAWIAILKKYELN
jgi:DNA (cytosine-5)-methyltransferase 1